MTQRRVAIAIPGDRAALVAIVLGAALGCKRDVEPHAIANFVYADHVGLAVMQSGGGCLAIQNAVLASGTRIALVDPGDSAKFARAIEARIADRAATPCDNHLAATRAGAAPTFYRLDAVAGAPATVMFAVVNAAGPVSIQEGRAGADFDGDGTSEHFRMCASREGMHFTVWSGEPLTGTVRWHRYYNAGHSTQPNCTAADTGADR